MRTQKGKMQQYRQFMPQSTREHRTLANTDLRLRATVFRHQLIAWAAGPICTILRGFHLRAITKALQGGPPFAMSILRSNHPATAVLMSCWLRRGRALSKMRRITAPAR